MKRSQIILLLITILISNMFGQEINNSPWHITADNYNNYNGISIANGRLGLMSSEIPFETRWLILNNVYEKESTLGVSKILYGINFGKLEIIVDKQKVTLDNITNWNQTINLKDGSITTSFEFSDKVNFEYTIYALRHLPYNGLIDVTISAKKNVNVDVTGFIVTPGEYKNLISTFRILRDLEHRMPLLQTVAETKFARHKLATTASFLFVDENYPELKHDNSNGYDNRLTFTHKLQKDEVFNFAWSGATCTTADFVDPQNESERLVIFTQKDKKENILKRHKAEWSKLWASDIEIIGDLKAQRDVRLAIYHLYAFSREGSELSIPPMGLSSQGYNGHIFWDSEIWMYPPLLLLNQEFAKAMLDYRFNKLEKAKQKAHNFGYKGAMYPWESDDTGEEATPTWALTGTFEHHITADVGIAFWNYFLVTKDKEWLKEKGYPVLKEVADFWVSRSTKNSDGSYSINNVVGANEFQANIDDNSFTNGSAKVVLQNASQAAEILNKEPDPLWEIVSDNIVIRKFEDGTTRENSTYNGELIKQADVNLLAYPLGVITDEKQILRDIEYYEPKISHEGPAMAHSILSIIHSRYGNPQKAFSLFKKGYIPNKRTPFGALSESATLDNPYFATGAGGMLQAVLFGFGGLELSESGIIQGKSNLPNSWEKLILKGIGPGKKTFVIKR